jgi:hypothetical protein
MTRQYFMRIQCGGRQETANRHNRTSIQGNINQIKRWHMSRNAHPSSQGSINQEEYNRRETQDKLASLSSSSTTWLNHPSHPPASKTFSYRSLVHSIDPQPPPPSADGRWQVEEHRSVSSSASTG